MASNVKKALQETDIKTGLETQEVKRRLVEFGYNEVPDKKISFWARLGIPSIQKLLKTSIAVIIRQMQVFPLHLIFLPLLCNYRKSAFAIYTQIVFCFDPLIARDSSIATIKNAGTIVHNGNSGIDGEAEGLGLNVVVGVELSDEVGDGEVL
jgi:hypothetical protein